MSHPTKPAKPRPDFPLFQHATGRWAKKVRGKFQYFGKIADDPQGEAALARWLAEKDDLVGRTPRSKSNAAAGITVGHVCNRYLSTQKLEYHELSPHSFRDNEETCTRLVDAFGGTGADVSREPRGTRSKFRSEKQRIPGGRH